jgi:ATP/maltotriose-dependent transcriptional regulator MalT
MNVLRKVLAPALPSMLLHREQLSQILGEALGSSNNLSTSPPHRLILLCAPAGYDKTTLLADTVKHLALPCCWLAFDHTDRQPSTFLTLLLSSISQRFPSINSRLYTLLKDDDTQNEACFTMMDKLLDLLHANISERWILSLCNYHEVNDNPLIKNLVNHLLKHLPSQCVLVIESRGVPDLELASLIAHRQLFGLGSESLRFSVEEISALAQIQNLPMFSQEEAAQIVTAFDGWIAGMLLASRLGAASFEAFPSAHKYVRTTTFTDRKHLLAFVRSEVFDNETALYTFLKNTSFLAHLAPAFCDALFNTSHSAVLLERAEHQGLFVTCSLEAGKRLYHCHQSIRELFQEELRQHEPEAARDLHHRIARLYYQTHIYQYALTHSLEAQAYSLTAKILLEASTSLLEQGQSELVLHSLDSLPPQVKEHHPRLLLIQINTYLRRGDATHALHCFEQTPHLISVLAHSEQTLTRAELAIVQGRLFLQQEAHFLAQKNFQEALEWLPIDERKLRLQAHQQCGVCSILSGQPVHEGIAHLQQVLQLCNAQSAY